MTEPILAQAGLWAAQLKEHGLIGDTAAERLNRILTESFAERLDKPEDPLLVAMLCGPTAVGKSSLINALAGAPISQPGLGATTAAAVLYLHEDDDPDRLLGYSQALSGRNQAETVLVRHRRAALRHKAIVDTPDIDSVQLRHRALTATLVHSADLVLFVTSPEKYKVVQAARWILDQRGQRALAFALNKWDRSGLGLQLDRRESIERDFRQVLAGEGFSDPLIFKVSALPDQGEAIENDLPGLQDWLESGLNQSTANSIRNRRLRAAWGRLAAAIEEAVPEALSAHPLLAGLQEELTRHCAMTEQSVVAEAAIVDAAGLEDGVMPVTPGVLGMWMRGWRRLLDVGASVRAGIGALGAAVRHKGTTEPAVVRVFGAGRGTTLANALREATRDAAPRGLRLGPVETAWTATFTSLDRDLGALPLDIASDLAVRAGRPGIRRVVGLLCLYGVEALILAVLLIAVYRAGNDFLAGTYAPGSLLGTVLTLLIILLLVGQTIGAVFFPPLQQRLRRLVAQRARALMKAATQRAEAALAGHVETVDRLAREGQDLLARIDGTVTGLSAPVDTPVRRLFAETPVLIDNRPADPVPVEPPPGNATRRPVFD
jgi:energy-coupling factor transporter ATP-binding protein EcfA2